LRDGSAGAIPQFQLWGFWWVVFSC
jgi:hypothetical protein